MRKVICFLVMFVMLFSLSIVANATEKLNDNDFALSYTIYDKDMNVKETGIIPNENLRKDFPGVTLANNEAVIFKPDNELGLYAVNGTKMTVKYTLNRSALHHFDFSGYTYGIVSQGDITASSNTFTKTAPKSDYYYLLMRNLSSDPIQIKTISINF